MKKRILLYAAKFMNIYLDIVNCLEELGFEVIWIEANTIPNNPYNKTLGLYNHKNIDDYMAKAAKKWDKLLSSDNLKEPIDYFLSIVGIDIPPLVLQDLLVRNPQIRKVLYLYDRVDGVYQIDEFFQYYDEVFSFDKSDCNRFNLSFLPIYWVPAIQSKNIIKYDIFAFASYSELKQDRTILFRKLKRIAKKGKYSEFVKLYDKSYSQNKLVFTLKNIVKYLLKRNALSLSDILNGLITGKSVMPDEYRQLINCSNVVFDTQASYQDGLTARFMWALGTGRKIITTNTHAEEYDFFREDQIFILRDNFDDIETFICKPNILVPSHMQSIEQYRIDNWINTLLSNNN